ncbi:TPA: twin-arginine translocase TatA/TatE family subunit [Candidatus Poribacteria bacterium]|jgi:sec-independent protein translocase protein TatA|nr:twin-arginine translocase TatA/TatE family subunit [Candidatus Poribacteria bacterium]HIA70165.1 twin-arginine translocase TatA/TatE family subunit [Candidatus Poribacteria bacterium]HIB89500.1 twin-arginine translocase TatA/TatE family subunit [Candidatus Poribacteria bacterium]HIC01744.1 twin-arginine translocase TatA/TatE family subunit [Candidatus Poribacteria bacterium]HIC19307.1 twin-arginine translocase TatA/TatE family subunit [Candidatus Poribacteria bacterium]|tara:strand:+ start:193 stop:396 length:204 start_codon:yes stop_codon:yes gene_type:complete
MGALGGWEIILIVIAVLVIFGPKRLPEMGSALGKAIRDFKNAGKEIQNDIAQTVNENGSDINSKKDA